MADGKVLTLTNVSCGFAQNVVHAFDTQAPPNDMFMAKSPATGRIYTFRCMNNSNGQFCGGGDIENNGSVVWH